jgi:hypothetical protein
MAGRLGRAFLLKLSFMHVDQARARAASLREIYIWISN